MPGSLDTATEEWQYRHGTRAWPACTSWRKKIGCRGPGSDPVSVITGALNAGAVCPLWAAAGRVPHTARKIPAATRPALLFVIQGARWRMWRRVELPRAAECSGPGTGRKYERRPIPGATESDA